MKQLVSEKNSWIFDLDGTITKPLFNFPKIKQALQIPQNEEILQSIASLSVDEQKKKIALLDQIEKDIAFASEAQNGFIKLITLLKKRQYNLGILTKNTEENALISLKKMQLERYFDRENIIDRDKAAHKPSKDGIELFFKKWRVSASQVVMSGDHVDDILCGKNAGVTTLLIDNDPKKGLQIDSDYKITSWLELL